MIRQKANKMDTPKSEKIEPLDMLIRALSLLSIMLGAFIFGAGANPLAFVSVPSTVAIFVAVCAGSYGLFHRGFTGLLIFAGGNTLLGSAILGGMIPVWVYALGVPVAMAGIAYRIFRPA